MDIVEMLDRLAIEYCYAAADHRTDEMAVNYCIIAALLFDIAEGRRRQLN